MDRLNGVHGRLTSLQSLLLTVLLISSLVLATTARRIPDKPSKSISEGPVLIKRGEYLPLYQSDVEDDSNTVIDGVKALGEWMISVGLTGEEETAGTDSILDSGELIDSVMDEKPTVKSEFDTLRREDHEVAAPIAPIATSPYDFACYRRGYLTNKTGSVNKCKGYDCRIASMTCEGQTFEGSQVYTYPGTMDHCVVNSLSCPRKIVQEEAFPRSCKIEKFLCPNNITRLPAEATGQDIPACSVQVICPSADNTNFTFFGYEAFDFACTNSQLYCDGKVVTSPNGYRAGGNDTCEIRPVACAAVGDVTSMCNQITENCATDPTDNTCSSLVDHAFSCPTTPGTPRTYATIESITCGSETHHYPTWSGSISTCLSVRSIKQNGAIITLPYNASANSYCVLSELDCGGVRTPWNFTARIPENCGVSRVICGNTPSLLNPTMPTCERHDFGCRTSPQVCTYTERVLPCATRCMQPGIVETCDCPVDFTGARCGTPRTLQCSFNVTSATMKKPGAIQPVTYDWNKDCSAGLDKRHLGDPICHKMDSDDVLTLTGNVLCNFTEAPLETLLKNIVHDFNYTLMAPGFRYSNVSNWRNWNLWMKLLNYNAFTDLAGSTIAQLTPAQMAGNDSVTFTLQPSRVKDAYKPGGRIRAEWQFLDPFNSPNGMYREVMMGATIDDMEWQPNYPHATKPFNTRILAVVLLSLFGVAVAALYIYRYWKKKRQEAASGST